MIKSDMKISCVVLFCDKDKMYIPRLIGSINKNLPYEHEIILIDNRDNQEEKLSFPGATIYSKNEGNVRQVEARRWSVQFCNGDYIWFIDADDEICSINKSELDEPLSHKCDMYTFTYLMDNGQNLIIFPEQGVHTDIFNAEMWNKIGSANWNKWYKKSMFEKVISYIPENTRITASEDIMFIALALKCSKTLYNHTSPIYIYHDNISQVSRKTVDSIEQFRWITYGYNDMSSILRKSLSLEEQGKLNIENMEYKDCAFFLNKACMSDNKELRKQIYKELQSMFSKNTIITAMIRNLPSWVPTDIVYRTILEFEEK